MCILKMFSYKNSKTRRLVALTGWFPTLCIRQTHPKRIWSHLQRTIHILPLTEAHPFRSPMYVQSARRSNANSEDSTSREHGRLTAVLAIGRGVGRSELLVGGVGWRSGGANTVPRMGRKRRASSAETSTAGVKHRSSAADSVLFVVPT